MWRFAVVMILGCGGAPPQVTARYDTDLDAVLSVATDVAKLNAKQVEIDREHATVETAWQVLASVREPQGFDYQGLAKIDGTAMTKYFARYEIRVVGPRPWQVVVAAHASRWHDGEPKPIVLPDDNPPAWLVERRDRIVEDINSRLRTSTIAPR
jgi:hypothetical protein